MKASDLQLLYKYINFCDTPFDYISMIQLFLKDIGHSDAYDYGIKKIFYLTIKLLSEEFDITEVTFTEPHGCDSDGFTTKTFNLVNVISNFENNELVMKDNNFKIILREPKFDLDTINNETKVFMDGIVGLEFEDGLFLKLSDLSTESKDGELSELETFMQMIDLDIYHEMNERMDSELFYIMTEKCSECDLEITKPSSSYLEILLILMKTILEIE